GDRALKKSAPLLALLAALPCSSASAADFSSPRLPPAPTPYNWEGLYIGGFIGGLTVGYNLQLPQMPLVLGTEGEYGYLEEYGSGRDVNQLYYSALIGDFLSEGSTHRTSVGSHYGYGLIGGRIGYAFNSLLIYVKAAAL